MQNLNNLIGLVKYANSATDIPGLGTDTSYPNNDWYYELSDAINGADKKSSPSFTLPGQQESLPYNGGGISSGDAPKAVTLDALNPPKQSFMDVVLNKRPVEDIFPALPPKADKKIEPSYWEQIVQWAKENPALAATVGIGGAAGLGGLGYYLLSDDDDEEEEEEEY